MVWVVKSIIPAVYTPTSTADEEFALGIDIDVTPMKSARGFDRRARVKMTAETGSFGLRERL